MSPEPTDQTSEVPWLGVAIAMIVIGLVVSVTLSMADPPPPPSEPDAVLHDHPDLGDWAPFADVGVPSDASADSSRKPED